MKGEKSNRKCTINGCFDSHISKGLCIHHYNELIRTPRRRERLELWTIKEQLAQKMAFNEYDEEKVFWDLRAELAIDFFLKLLPKEKELDAPMSEYSDYNNNVIGYNQYRQDLMKELGV